MEEAKLQLESSEQQKLLLRERALIALDRHSPVELDLSTLNATIDHNHVHWSWKHLEATSLVSFGSEDIHVTIYSKQATQVMPKWESSLSKPWFLRGTMNFVLKNAKIFENQNHILEMRSNLQVLVEPTNKNIRQTGHAINKNRFLLYC